MFEVTFVKLEKPISYAVSIPLALTIIPSLSGFFSRVDAETVFNMTVSKVVVGPDGNPEVGVQFQ